MKQYLYWLGVFAVAAIIIWPQPKRNFLNTATSKEFPQPIGDDEGELQKIRAKWWEDIHGGPNSNWWAIEAQNRENNLKIKKEKRRIKNTLAIESFAQGKLLGEWFERGATNQAGRVRAVEFDTLTNNLYIVTEGGNISFLGGSLWKGTLAGTWELLNDDYLFEARTLCLVHKANGQLRILTAANNNILWSDNEGATFTPATGIEMPPTNPIGVNSHDIIEKILVGANNEIYVFAEATNYLLFWSNDLGQTFKKIHPFNMGSVNADVDRPYNSSRIIAVDFESDSDTIITSEVIGDQVVTLNKAVARSPRWAGGIRIKAVSINQKLIINASIYNYFFYRSYDEGKTWQYMSDYPVNDLPWWVVDASAIDSTVVYFGGVNAYRSTNSGRSWTKVNNWTEYYGNEATKLHADMMQFKQFRKMDGTSFMLITCDGGAYVSYNNMATVSNLGMLGFNCAQYYDVVTDPDHTQYLFAGSQDQGFQRNTYATGHGLLNFEQMISGDFGHIVLSGNPKSLWCVYPNGLIEHLNGYTGYQWNAWNVPGASKPYWLGPITNIHDRNKDEIYLAGGDLTGGSGNYLIRLRYDASNPNLFVATQLPGNLASFGTIGAIEADKLNPNRIYVGTRENWFHVTDTLGLGWTRTLVYPTPWQFYGTKILSSSLTPNLVWYAGSAYQTYPYCSIMQSTDGGLQFVAITNGLPRTLIHDLATNPDESMLFAATDAGPYVYIRSENYWYPMIGASTPLQVYTSVEFIPSLNTVRFGTYGRGIWDFVIQTPLPVTGLNLTARVDNHGQANLTWTTRTESNTRFFAVERSMNASEFSHISTAPSKGNSNLQQQYAYTDLQTPAGKVYYRIKLVGSNGKQAYSNIAFITSSRLQHAITIAPNPVQANMLMVRLNMPAALSQANFIIVSSSGQPVIQWTQRLPSGISTLSKQIAGLPTGHYTLVVQGNGFKEKAAFVKP